MEPSHGGDDGVRFTHVLITRPQPEAGQLAERFGTGPLRPIVMPAFAFEPYPARLPRSFAEASGERRLAVFTSTRAVRFGLRQLPAQYLDGAEVAAIGPATAAALEEAGCPVSLVPPDGFTSEALLSHPSLGGGVGEALIFAAPGGRDALRRGFERLGWNVGVIHVYQRVPCPLDEAGVEALEASQGVLSVWTSGNAMQELSARLPPGAWRTVLEGAAVVISQRLRGLALEHGFACAEVAAGPDNACLYAAVMELT